MPVRSLSSSVLVWPNRARVDDAVRQWAADVAGQRPELRRLGYFGSYARGDWGVGSDLDLIAIVSDCADRFEQRALAWDLTPLPVPAEILIYTQREWDNLQDGGGRFARTVAHETVWVVP